MSNVDEQLKELASTFGQNVEIVKEEFDTLRQMPDLKNNQYFKTDLDRDDYCLRALKVRMAHRPDAKEYALVPVGFGSLRRSKDKRGREYLWSEVYALFPEEDKGDPRVRRISVKHNPTCFRDLNYEPAHIYDVFLSKFQSGDFQAADGRTKWDNPRPVPPGADPLDFVTRITVAQVPSHVAKKSGDYPDNTDWRVIRGIVAGTNSGDKKDASLGKWSYFDIGDGTLVEPIEVDETGRKLYPALRTWCPYELLPNLEEEIEVFGTISMDEAGFTMQAYWVRRLVRRAAEVLEDVTV